MTLGRSYRTAARAALAVGLASVFAGAQSPPTAPNVVRLEVRISNVRSNNGMVRCLLFAGPEGFPTRPERAMAQQRVPPRGGAAQCVFERVPRGTYAVAIHHDENNNGRVDIGFFGPTEPLAASRNARGFLGPPSFDAARFSVTSDWQIPIRM
jgi:uncharacterized protein (DUF2141 family)